MASYNLSEDKETKNCFPFFLNQPHKAAKKKSATPPNAKTSRQSHSIRFDSRGLRQLHEIREAVGVGSPVHGILGCLTSTERPGGFWAASVRLWRNPHWMTVHLEQLCISLLGKPSLEIWV